MAFIKVQSTKNNLGNITNLLKNYVFGDKTITEYSESATYNKGDLVYVVANDTVTIYEALTDGITGTFDDADWKLYTIGTTVTEISDTKPVNPSNNVWLKPVREATYNLPTEFI